MQENERIELDAKVLSVIKDGVFCAALSNGHTFVAYEREIESSGSRNELEGRTVRVRMSPFDMSKGLVIAWPQYRGDRDES